MLALQDQLFSGLEMWEPPTLSSDFTARTVALAMKPAATVTRKPLAFSARIGWAIGAAIAASLLLAALPLLRQQPVAGPQAPLVNQPDSEIPQPVIPNNAVVVVPPVQRPLLTPEASPQLAFTAEQLTAGGEEMLRSLQQWPEVPVDESVERIPGLRPIANSFGLAIGVVRRSLPGGKETPASPEPKQPPLTKPQAEAGPDRENSIV
ncbi:MAG TPA: hypothetical protein VL096_19660 [Pirellulaceae bacterium]|nr:hypothetical protein [Pirellulaceae bacterium]